MKRLVVLFGLLCITASAVSSEKLDWAQLLPAPKMDSTALPTLTEQQKSWMKMVLALRAKRESQALTKPEVEKLQSDSEKLREQGIEASDYFKRLMAVVRERNDRGSQPIKGLNKEDIEINGFLIPLEFEGMVGVKFLLVPTAGACIHTPPPPPNQMAIVDFKEGFSLASLYTPVTVTGHLQTGNTSAEVGLSDGSIDVTIGYELDAESIEILSAY